MNVLRKASSTVQINATQKFLLPCQKKVDSFSSKNTKEWLQIRNKLVEKAPVLQGILTSNKDVVVKYGTPDLMTNEYTISETLYKNKIPNMMKYYCSFKCIDDISTVVQKGYLCGTDTGTETAYIIMPFYVLGDMNKYVWNRGSFGLLKSVLTQICYSVLYASQTCGFVHNDLHMFNVLLRKTKKTHLVYGNITLQIECLYAMIMDFERSKVDTGLPRDAYLTIRGVLNLATNLDNSDLALLCDTAVLTSWMTTNTPITQETYAEVKKLIDRMSIAYVKSELPPNPFLPK